MLKSREPEKPVSSETSSGEEETDDSSSEEIESEPEPSRKSSPPPAAARKPHTPSGAKPDPPEEDSGSESDKKSRKNSKAKGTVAASTSRVRPTRKRAVEKVKGTEPTVTKKSKNSKEAEPEASEKKQLFQRLWSESDEIALLNGIMQFRAEKKSDPSDNMDAFLAFIKKDLHIDVTKTQMKKKISRMKEKYTSNKRKEQEGKRRAFTSQHEQEAYDLSEKVWGAEKEKGVEKANGSAAENFTRRHEQETYDLPEKVWGAEKESANGSEAEKENGNGSGAGEKEKMVEKGNGSGAETVGSARRFVWMRKSLLRGLGDVPAVEDKKGQMGNKEDDEALENQEIEEMKAYLRLFELKAEKAKLFVQTMIKSRGH
ncbi:DNA-binding storekeeper protein-relatedtranscriptional regulator [Striga asiatica]|uniref:DNA-binding storekeeper protein-relatedtranscriptional regulator n=1 Tax=Striga asiatica TaxID=4170 RepID=A0A5A7QVB5_STRAF|nr:DNA-binding storekeeper protein-relatedtranscriptional regulator [Striga asiatica]